MVLTGCAAFASAESPRTLRGVVPRTSTVVVAEEGQFEPRSTGSYSVRVYGGTNARFPYDDFIAGAVRPRDGAIVSLVFGDVTGGKTPEIVVVIRSAGTGGYLSADAFHLDGNTLSLVESVAGLAKDADPVHALRAKHANERR